MSGDRGRQSFFQKGVDVRKSMAISSLKYLAIFLILQQYIKHFTNFFKIPAVIQFNSKIYPNILTIFKTTCWTRVSITKLPSSIEEKKKFVLNSGKTVLIVLERLNKI